MKLFGGAITADIPDFLDDASKFRDVPDNQEMFVGEIGGLTTGFIVELTEPVDWESPTAHSLRKHVNDVHRSAGAEPEDISTLVAQSEVRHEQKVALMIDLVKDKKKGSIFCVFGLFRLEKYHTDVFLTYSVEFSQKEITRDSVQWHQIAATRALESFNSTFEVVDPSLFHSS